jgi:hypothetical protein
LIEPELLTELLRGAAALGTEDGLKDVHTARPF